MKPDSQEAHPRESVVASLPLAALSIAHRFPAYALRLSENAVVFLFISICKCLDLSLFSAVSAP
jgi:hypothetical protein